MDRAFVERKLARFNERYDKSHDEKLKKQLMGIFRDVTKALSKEDYATANRALNRGFRLLDKSPVVDFEAVRVGPLVQVSARLFDAAGALVDARERTAEAAAFPGEGALLDAELLESTAALAPPAPAKPPPPAEEVELIETATPEEPDDPEALPVLGYSGIGVGVLALSAGGALATLGFAGE